MYETWKQPKEEMCSHCSSAMPDRLSPPVLGSLKSRPGQFKRYTWKMILFQAPKLFWDKHIYLFVHDCSYAGKHCRPYAAEAATQTGKDIEYQAVIQAAHDWQQMFARHA